MPTANLGLGAHQALPAAGVYAVRAHIGETAHPAVANIGTRPTFGGTRTVFEVHVLDGEPELYGLDLCVSFVAHIRDERRFDGVEALVSQIHRDIDAARALV